MIADKVAYMFGGMNRGGAETLLLDVFCNWQKAPFSFIGVHRKEGAYKDAFYSAGPTLYHLAPKQFGHLRYFFRLRQLLKNEGVSIIHTQHWLDCIYAYIATIGIPVRIINTFHGFYSLTGINGLLCRLSIRLADAVCFVSHHEKEWYQNRCRIADSKCYVIYNGVDFSKIDSAQTSMTFDNQPRRIRLAMVGNFVGNRSQIVVCKAINILKKRDITNFDFYFIGKMNEKEPEFYDDCVMYCKDHHLDNVRFLGSRDDVPSLLKSMDGFVYSTNNDTFGIAIIEAIATGLPIVTNDWFVMKEICRDLSVDTVRYFQTGDSEDCARQMMALIETLEKSKQSAIKDSLHIKKRFSIEQYIDNLYYLYNYMRR